MTMLMRCLWQMMNLEFEAVESRYLASCARLIFEMHKVRLKRAEAE